MILAAAAITVSASAQQRTAEEYLQRYNMLTERLGLDGVGVETIVQNWEKDFPEDENMLVAKWAYYLTKSATTEVVSMDKEKYLGSAPVLSLKDSLGNNVNYFQKITFDDDLFAQASQAIDQAIKQNPLNLDYRVKKIETLIAYEGDSPDMAGTAVRSLIDYNYTSKPQWVYDGGAATVEDFENSVQDFCYSFYNMGTPSAYEAFRNTAQKMIDYKSRNVVFQDDLGSYWQVAKQDTKQAMKYYKKVLKTKPDDYTAIKNSVLIARRDKDVKSEKKYLQMLAKYAPTDIEKESARVRLQALK